MYIILCWLWSNYIAYVKRYFVLLYLDLVVNYSEIIDSDGSKAKTMLAVSMVCWNNIQVMGYNFTITCHHQARVFFPLVRRLTCPFRAAHYSSSHLLSCYHLISLWFPSDARVCHDLCGLVNKHALQTLNLALAG